MQEKNSLGFWKWLMIMLVVCNIALVATIWVKPGKPNDAQRKPPINFKEELRLTPQQNETFMQMVKAQHMKIDSIKRQANNVRQLFFANIKNSNANPLYQDSLAEVLGHYHKLIEEQTYLHFSQVRELLSADQKKIFDNIIGDVLKSLPEQPHYRGDGMRPGRTQMDEGQRPDGQGPPPDDNNPPPAN